MYLRFLWPLPSHSHPSPRGEQGGASPLEREIQGGACSRDAVLSATSETNWRGMRCRDADRPGRCEDPPREGHTQQGASVRLPSRSASAHPLNQPWQHWSVRSASATASAKATTPRRIRTRVDSRRSTLAEQDIEAAPGGYDSDHRELNIVHPPPRGRFE